MRSTFPACVFGSCGVAPVVVRYSDASRPNASRTAAPVPSSRTKMSFMSAMALPSQRPRAIAAVRRFSSSGLV